MSQIMFYLNSLVAMLVGAVALGWAVDGYSRLARLGRQDSGTDLQRLSVWGIVSRYCPVRSEFPHRPYEVAGFRGCPFRHYSE